ncbi:MAG: ABC transporter ATP-binding protein [Pseudomonadota bacterium]
MTAPLALMHGVSKSFPRATRRGERLRALAALLAGRTRVDACTVLDGIDLEVRRGESLGIVGENGAGKSTLLKLLTGVLAPTAGRIETRGSIAALLELGAGFHPEFTGAENIDMAGALLGFAPGELAARREQILAFADLGRYIDEPVKHYSTGMVVRLGFALVAARRPDLLITDEVLAVGDESFQRKCIRWLEDYLADGGTLLLVSHSMYHVQKLCRHALWIHRGRIEARGDVHEVTQRYLAFQEQRIAAERGANAAGAAVQEFQVAALEVNGEPGEAPVAIEQGGRLVLDVRVYSRAGREPTLAIGLVRADGTPVYGITSEIDGVRPRPHSGGGFAFRLVFDALPLLPGSYWLRAHSQDPEAMRHFDTAERLLVVRGRSRELGLVHLRHRWDGEGP